MVRIRLQTGPDQITGQPMTRNAAIVILFELYELNPTKWGNNEQTFVGGNSGKLWTVTLIPA